MFEDIEFYGCLIDVVEDFLEARGVTLNNEDKEQAILDGEDPRSLAIIYGEDFDELEYGFRRVVEAFREEA